ncbi:type 2 isopentenyl-diphosphate Delta-isomerase [soil metagenome]
MGNPTSILNATVLNGNQNHEPLKDRKKDHIQLAFESQTGAKDLDERFYYEPMLSAHADEPLAPVRFLGKTMRAPLWISSMTGGTEQAHRINHNLAKVCKEFGLGMGLGSCRVLLEENNRFQDFNLRPVIGYESPFYANLGIAQLEQAIENGTLKMVGEMVNRLRADGLIVHVNPLQEWLQPEGDHIVNPPIDTIKRLLDAFDFKIIVKEVGQGMGPKSLRALFQLPLAAIDFAAFGGTNFAKLELLRGQEGNMQLYKEVARLGHDACSMVEMANQIINELGDKAICKEVIVSGGIHSFLDGYYLINKINCNSVYGQGSAFLKHARGTYGELQQYVQGQIKGLEMANAFLEVKDAYKEPKFIF